MWTTSWLLGHVPHLTIFFLSQDPFIHWSISSDGVSIYLANTPISSLNSLNLTFSFNLIFILYEYSYVGSWSSLYIFKLKCYFLLWALLYVNTSLVLTLLCSSIVFQTWSNRFEILLSRTFTTLQFGVPNYMVWYLRCLAGQPYLSIWTGFLWTRICIILCTFHFFPRFLIFWNLLVYLV